MRVFLLILPFEISKSILIFFRWHKNTQSSHRKVGRGRVSWASRVGSGEAPELGVAVERGPHGGWLQDRGWQVFRGLE